MGYVQILGECIACHRMFTFNPHRVPSTTALTGEREPICRDCFDDLNRKRAAAGLEPFTRHPDAYEAIPEEEF